MPLLGLEAELTWYPGHYPEDEPFSRRRLEGLFGATVGPQFERFRAFARLRPGFLAYGKSPEPLFCIGIFPPPLECKLGEGATLLAVDLGGGVEVDLTSRTLLRLDIGDRIVRYDGPVLADGRGRRQGRGRTQRGFWSHDARVTIGAGWRF